MTFRLDLYGPKGALSKTQADTRQQSSAENSFIHTTMNMTAYKHDIGSESRVKGVQSVRGLACNNNSYSKPS